MPHYFDETPDAPTAPRIIDVALPDVAFTMTTDRGVFSHGHVDVGTALLLRQAGDLPESGTLLDLGCGAGVIAITMALRRPGATVWAVDVNTRARALTAGNAERLGITNLRVARPEDVPGDVQFDAMWSNPPIRIGKAALHELLDVWLQRLSPHGTATLVVQRHLGADSLADWLNRRGYHTERIASRAGFRLLFVQASNSPHTSPSQLEGPTT